MGKTVFDSKNHTKEMSEDERREWYVLALAELRRRAKEEGVRYSLCGVMNRVLYMQRGTEARSDILDFFPELVKPHKARERWDVYWWHPADWQSRERALVEAIYRLCK